MRQNFFLFVLMFCSAMLFSQKTISGKITDDDGIGIPSASVTVEEPGKDAILAYGITNSKGEYKITFTSSESNVDLKVKGFNQKPITKQISNTDQNLNFKMQSEATEIKEVQLKTKLITARGDTIAYDLKAFDSKSDRTLADVMKKIPGIEVNADGTVLYQGNAINKFYVEGKDLMEGGYGTITNSLPKDAIAKLEVLENHQPVKMLQGKIPSDAAAINIKLKKSVTMTGRGEVGIGADPLLWNVKLTPMFFSKTSQWVVNYKTNNVGDQVENEGNILGSYNPWEGRRGNVSQNNWLSVEEANTPSTPVRRYLFNNVHYASANYLTNIDKAKQWELKAIANYTNNSVERADYSETTYQTGALAGNKIINSISNNFYTDKIRGELLFTKNAKKGFFKNSTSFSQFWNGDRASVIRQGISAGQSVESPTSNFQNSLSTIIPWKEKMVNLRSYISYQDDQQTLEIDPASYLQIPYLLPKKNPSDPDEKPRYGTTVFASGTRAIQQFRIKTLDTSHSANISFTKKGWTFTPSVGFDYSTDKLMTNFNGSAVVDPLNPTVVPLNFDSPSYENNLKFTEINPNAALGINYKTDVWNVFANLPVNFTNINAEDDARNVSKTLNRTTFTPNLFAQYTFASFWKASINANFSNSFGDIQSAYAGNLLMRPTGFSVMDANNPIPQTKSSSTGARLEYRNPLNNLFFNVNYGYTFTNRNLLQAPILDTNTGFTRTTFLNIENDANTNRFNAEVGKYFPNFKTNASVNYRNTTSVSDAFLDGSAFKNKNNSQSYGFKLNNTYFSWMSVDFNMSLSKTKQESLRGALPANKGYNHNLSTFFYPLEDHTIGFAWDQLNTINNGTSYKNPFFDLSYQFTWSKKKIDFELKWMNISNRKVFETFNLDGQFNALTYTRIQLRPSQVMFTVKFNFK